MGVYSNQRRDGSRDQVLAGGYVLGTLTPEQRREVRSRIRYDDAFAAIVGRWQENLINFTDEYEASPRPRMSPEIKQALSAVEKPNILFRLWRSVGFWRFATIAAAGFAALSVVSVQDATLGSRGQSTSVMKTDLRTETPIGPVAQLTAQ